MTDQLKTEWELRADLEAEERRARQIRQADALTEMARADEEDGLLNEKRADDD